MLIEKATEYENGPEKDALVRAIANQMKKSYLNYNRESVNDDLIEKHLDILSESRLKLHEDMRLTATNDILAARNKKKKPFRPKGDNSFKGRKKPQ